MSSVRAIGYVAALLAGLSGFSSAAWADPRPFVFSNDTYPMGRGDWEYEQHVTWRTDKDNEEGYDRVDFRHEFEFGLADNFDLAIYLPTWRIENSDERSGSHFDSVDVEGIVYFSNPTTDFVGIGLYNEVGVGEEELKFEHKLLVQKDIGKWVFLYNLILETEVEGVFDDGDDEEDEETEVTGEIAHTFGVSYAVVPGWFLGGEAIVESEYADWSDYEQTTVYAGPAISYQGHENLWVTVTPTFQLTDEEDQANFRVRMIAGWEF